MKKGDGLNMSKGKKNMYVCQTCGYKIVTVDIDEGVTPFMIGCKRENCDGDMYSFFYRINPLLEPTYEWYKPNLEDYSEEHRELMRNHIENGGLDIRKINKT